jgi:hypothetical protein
METADQSNSHIVPPSIDDPEEQGLRILAKIIARFLARSRRNTVDKVHGYEPDDLSQPGDAA